ncbi:DinB family protein [Streptomyces litchfieldiae]|uniref:DinB family protein n=1 Tax=Streptomyces litchfieldiae TaxID=3075543 RepID=A0ABU2MY78_9ACTN|nr:DinB family protein [Streptomyces sp. DSM 44938]MDT0346471.1 DinB family protein [Streptomyces sp. DSM 44938]
MAREDGWQRLALGLFRRVRSELIKSVDGVGEAALDWRPSPGSNGIGWLAWHVARGQDRNLSELMGAPQRWLSDGWADRFGRPADPSDTGFGHSAAQAAAFRSPGSQVLLAYHGAVHDLAERYLRAAPDDDLGRIVVSPTLGNEHTVEERLRGLLTDSLAHLGQIAMLRGLMPDGTH